MKKKDRKKARNYYCIEELLDYMNLSAEDKLNYLEEVNVFFHKAMPKKSKEAWKKLKADGW